MHKVKSVTPLHDYLILAEFENGEKRIRDVKPLIAKGGMFAALTDNDLFKSVHLEFGAVTWKDNDGNEMDICPDKLYMDSVPYADAV